MREVFRYDWETRPYHDAMAQAEGAGIVDIGGEGFYERGNLSFKFDVPAALEADPAARYIPQPTPGQSLYYKTGFEQVCDSHEFISRFVGRTYDEAREEVLLRSQGMKTLSLPSQVAGLTKLDEGPRYAKAPFLTMESE